MKTKNFMLVSSEPTAFITKNKQRIKQFNNIVYLNDSDEFEIEFFNPTTFPILAKIEMDGELISQSGLIIKQGERIFLDRYLDKKNKFKFETYTVENSTEALNAIRNNGTIKIDFYRLTKNQFNNFDWFNVYYYNNNDIKYGKCTMLNNYPNNITFSATTPTLGMNTSIVHDQFLNQSFDNNIETGQIGIGKHSEQAITNCDEYSIVSNVPITKIMWNILPYSRKLKTSEDLVQYCSNCGAKKKKTNYKFCPQCGNKF